MNALQRPFRSLLVAGILVTALGWPTPRPAADASCDPEILGRVRQGAGDLRYRQRGDRCEGFVSRKFGAGVFLDSFSAPVEVYDYGSPLTLSWTRPAAGPVHVRVTATTPEIHYQMDTQVEPSRRAFSWPPNILAAEQIESRQLRIAVWEVRPLGGDWLRVYLPPSLVQRQPLPATPDQYRVVLWTERELTQVYSTLERLDAKGAVEKPLTSRRREGRTFAESMLTMALDARALPAGLYRLTMDFDTNDGLVGPLRLHFQHAP